MVVTCSLILVAVIIIERIFEIRLAARNRRIVSAMGAKEYGRKHYPLMVLLHTGWLFGWLSEALLYNRLSEVWYVWLALFLLAEILRYWCILSLGQFWNTRIFVVPGTRLVQRGPYRFMTHPNYLAVSVVLLSVPLIFSAYITAIAATILNAALLLCIRIPAEERALKSISK
ncbi:MAG: isoprenylcysteine carboxyl methyltransferase family protein [Negativicutes bacterium]|jgi:methyltransferase